MNGAHLTCRIRFDVAIRCTNSVFALELELPEMTVKIDFSFDEECISVYWGVRFRLMIILVIF